jgi:preprotein translocase subunit SecG
MYHILLVIHVILTVAMIGIILIQRSSSDGLGGIGGGGGGGFLTSRGQANLLTRTTAILATLFILNSLALSWLTTQDTRATSIADKIVAEEKAAPKVPTPREEVVAPVEIKKDPVSTDKKTAIPQPKE